MSTLHAALAELADEWDAEDSTDAPTGDRTAELRALLAAHHAGETRVEWGVRCSKGDYRAGLEFDARLDVASDRHHNDCVGPRHLIRRTVTSFPDVVSEWEEVAGDE